MTGWIKISREIINHWIWNDPNKLKWWLDILITVNFEDKKIPIGYKLFECKRGESLMSLQSWGKRWGVSKTVVNNFFKLLENDNMITIKNETVTTRITVCKYEQYQQIENAKKTKQYRKENAIIPQQSTTKEGEEIEEVKEIIKEQDIVVFNFRKSLLELGIEKQIAFDWLKVRKDKNLSNTETAFNKIKSEIEKSKLTANECIKFAVEKSWGGYQWNWHLNEMNKNSQQNQGHQPNQIKQPYKPKITTKWE